MGVPKYASVLSSHLFLVFGSNLALVPKNKNQMHFSGYSEERHHFPLLAKGAGRICENLQ